MAAITASTSCRSKASPKRATASAVPSVVALMRLIVLLGVVARPEPVDDDDLGVADDPGVVAGGQGRDLARRGVELGAVGQLDPQGAGDVVLEVRGLAQVGARDRLDVVGPAPAR